MKQNNNLQIDRISFKIGMITCFVEMAAKKQSEIQLNSILNKSIIQKARKK